MGFRMIDSSIYYSPMRIIILSDRIPPENRGGAGRVAWQLAKGLYKNGHEVYVIAATEGKAFEEKRDGIPTYHLHSAYPRRFVPYLALYNPQTSGALKRLFSQLQPDVVNAHNVHVDLSYYALVIAHRMGFATVFNSHDVMPFAYHRLRHHIDPTRCGVTSPQLYRLPRWYNLRENRFRYNPFRNVAIHYILSRYADARISVSQAHRDALEANHLPTFEVVYNGVDPDEYAIAPELINHFKARLELSDRRVILLAGRPTADKGGRQLLMALSRVIERVPSTCLLILGPQQRIHLLEEPHFRHLTDYVRFGGWLEGQDLTAAFCAADVVTVPSIIMDSFPTVNLEAMAAGKPVVATCHGGSSEAVLDGQTGYIINPFNTEEYANALIRLLSDDQFANRMGKAGHERLLQKFTLQNQVQAMLEQYKQAIEKHR